MTSSRLLVAGAVLLATTLTSPCESRAQVAAPRRPSIDTIPRPAANPADVATPDAILKALYDVIGASLEASGFFEREISRKTEAYGNIMHVFSTYESRRTADLSEKPFARGINSIQLLKDGNRWWVVSIFWDAERPGTEIPAQYLPR